MEPQFMNHLNGVAETWNGVECYHAICVERSHLHRPTLRSGWRLNTHTRFSSCTTKHKPRYFAFKMSTRQEKVQCVLWLTETKSLKTIQRKFRLLNHRSLPSMPSIPAWLKMLKDT
ncbi:hypothetical protein AVEN_114043-1 [Araneus ventricosus]|uniref:DUF4817 domain-containing protein n=1 Tax=Araneus ventricosus TaxID=182803 RepID=A0A4Y2V8W2_ARAVE|nr:hypothetical protein AVEN_114043-1 [Araneus ventricosus]